MKTPRPRRTSQRYESSSETTAAIARIHSQIERTKESLAAEKEYSESPAGVLKTTLKSLLSARKAVAAARKELDGAIITLRRVLPRK